MHPLNESCYAGSELCRELACSRPPLKNASELRDMLLEIEDILRVLDRRLESCEQPRWDVAQSVVLALTSAVFASSRKPPIAPFRPGIGTSSKVVSRTVKASLRAGHVYSNALTTGSLVIRSLDLIVFSLAFIQRSNARILLDRLTVVRRVQIIDA